MVSLLSKTGQPVPVKSLLDNLQLTVEFESSMAKKWATPVRYTFQSGDGCDDTVWLVQTHVEHGRDDAGPTAKADVVCL